MRLPDRLTRITPRQALMALPVAVPLVALSVFVVRGCQSAAVPHYAAPPGVELPTGDPTTTAPGAGLTGVALLPVDGTTTTAPWPETGTSQLTGVVNGLQGPVPGAFVRAERVIPGAPTIGFSANTGPDGRYVMQGLPGGSYRVRAFLPPTLAQTEPTMFFLSVGEQRTTDLQVDQFGGLTVQVAVAPVPPLVNQPLNLVVQVTNRQVDTEGVVRAVPVPGASVQLASTGQWSGTVPQPSGVTNVTGEVTFPMTCRTAGPNTVTVVVRANAVDPPTQQNFDVGTCEAPPPTTTTTSTTTTTTQKPGN